MDSRGVRKIFGKPVLCKQEALREAPCHFHPS
jgi:hypothetical protein